MLLSASAVLIFPLPFRFFSFRCGSRHLYHSPLRILTPFVFSPHGSPPLIALERVPLGTTFWPLILNFFCNSFAPCHAEVRFSVSCSIPSCFCWENLDTGELFFSTSFFMGSSSLWRLLMVIFILPENSPGK